MTRPLRHAFDRRIIVLVSALLATLSACSGTDDTPPRALVVRSCPPWTAYPVDLHSNADSPYLGCVNAVNLQNMSDDLRDLDRGRTLGPANGERESLGVDAYKRGRIPPFKSANAPRPTISLPGAGGSGP